MDGQRAGHDGLGVGDVPDLTALGMPAAEEALLRLVVAAGRVTTGDAAARLGTSGAQVSRAAAALKDRGFLATGCGRSRGLVLAPLDRALDALLQSRREAHELELQELEATRRALLEVARWTPEPACPHELASRDLRQWHRRQELQRVERSVEIVDRHHVNSHVPAQALYAAHRTPRVSVRLLVTGATDDRPTEVVPPYTDLGVARAGIPVRRLAQRCAAFAVYDGRRVEVPLWRLEASGWSHEPGEAWAASRLFELLWEQAQPWPSGGAAPAGGPAHRPPSRWPVWPAAERSVVGSGP